MAPDRRSRRAVALPAGPIPTADQSPSQGNKGIISLNRHDSSNCLPVSTHPDVRRVFNEPSKKPRGPRHETPAKSVFAGSDRTFPRLTALRLYDYLLSRGDTRGPRQSCSIRPFFAVALENSSQSARGTFSVSPHWTAVSEVWFEIRYTSPAIDSDRAVSEGFGASSEASMRSESGAQLRTQRRTRTRPSPTFRLGTSVDRRTRVSHPRNAR